MTIWRSSLLRGSLAALVSRAVGVFISLLAGVIVARTWGPEGKGVLSLLSTATVLVVRLGVVGLDTAVAHFLLVRRVDAGRGLGTVFGLATLAGGIAALMGLLVLGLFPSVAGDVPMTAARLQVGALPAAFLLFVATYAFFALGRAVAFAQFDVGYRLGTLAATAGAAALGAGIVTLVVFQVAAAVTCALVGLGLIWRWSGGRWRWSPPVASAMMAYGARTYVYGLGRYVLAYGSLLISGARMGALEAGVLSVALMLGEVVALSAGSVNLAFGSSVSVSQQPWSHTWRVARHLTILMSALAVAIAIIAPTLVRGIFGANFAQSASIFPWLIPGVVALGAEQILGSYFARIGMSWRVAGVMAAGSALAAGVLFAASFDGLQTLAWATSLVQVAVTLVVFTEFGRMRHRDPAPGVTTEPPFVGRFDV